MESDTAAVGMTVQRGTELPSQFLTWQGDDGDVEVHRLPGQQLQLGATGCQTNHPELIGTRTDDVECLGADRSG